MRYTQDPPNLLLPTAATIEHLAKREGLGELTDLEWDFVWDLLAKTGGAQVAEFDEDKALLDAEVHGVLEAEAFVQRNPNVKMTYDPVDNFKRSYHAMQHQLHHVLVELDLNDIPGYNHSAKAIRMIKLIRNAEVLWFFMLLDLYFVETLFNLIDTAIQKVNTLASEDLGFLKQFVDPLSEESELDAKFLGIQLQVNGIDLQEVLRIARHLDTLNDLQGGRSKLRPDPNGEDVKPRNIRDLSELGRVSQQDLALPRRLRNVRAVQGELNIREPQTRRNKKQLLFMVVDGTASMLGDGATSASRAAGVLINRLQAVIDGDAELFIRFFDSTLREREYHAKDAKSARELIQIVSDPSQYLGTSTQFTPTLQAASVRIQELMKVGKLREPELMFVTDGSATIPDISVLNGVKMHTVQVGTSEVKALSKLARQSGGISVYAGFAEAA